MAIEIILKEHVEHLGRRGEVVKVAPGYARNFLFPRKLALAVTDANKRQIERERAKAEAKDAEELKEAQALQARLEALEVAIGRRVGEVRRAGVDQVGARLEVARVFRRVPVD